LSRRHLTALALALTVMVTLWACMPDYEWRRVRSPSESYEWIVVPRDKLAFYCGMAELGAVAACAWWNRDKCIVYSYYTETQAARVFSGDGIDLREHELRHCEGWLH
jgi:hypothetical protein